MVPFLNAPCTGHNTRMLQMRAHKIRFFSLLRSFDEFYLDGHKPNGDGIVAQLNTVEPSSFVHTWWVSIYFSYVWRTERALLGARIMEWK